MKVKDSFINFIKKEIMENSVLIIVAVVFFSLTSDEHAARSVAENRTRSFFMAIDLLI